MSIIYDALNKVEKNNPNSQGNDPKNKKPQSHKLYVLYGLILILGFIGAKAIVSLVFVAPKKQETIKPTSVVVKKEVLVPREVLIPKEALSVSQDSGQAADKIANQEQLPAKEVKNIEPPPLVLNGVFISPNEKYAIINNQIVREGDKIDGATVLSIMESKVEVDYEGFKISITSGK